MGAASKDMNMQHMDSSMILTILTVGLYLLASLTVQGIAGLFAILAGASTFALNAYRFYKEYKESQDKKK